MLVDERRNKIKEIVLKEKSVRVADLVRWFNVSEETIRRDLSKLEKEGLVKKTYGGAILAEELQSAMLFIPPVQQRKVQFYQEKDIIGRRAAEMIFDGSTVILDAGSTTWSISKYISSCEGITVVTNSIDIAQELSKDDKVEVIVVGGKLIKKSMSLVGPQAEKAFRSYNADIVFLGVSGISLNKGFTSSDIYEAEIKRTMMFAAQKRVIVADHSKFERQGLITFADFKEIDAVVTSSLVDRELLKAIKDLGIEVIVCEVTEDASEACL
ncbi:DeoR family transcriptional regulator of aga operon/DeoR family myo-inositol catabolism operon transcriptional repressor [Caldicoprobacter guelmensis]|uniref:DeoR family transcriptional regulator n=1 Tax=Caldicoprobacter guelmensis TaxID=1170224 RepID=UPI00195C7FD6|nr:DeoR family transcriptional regulator of aga operon/DeoR family myo-inositol catabolism operon transcriptional repressor [Caldicoprobacter guelmensis]